MINYFSIPAKRNASKEDDTNIPPSKSNDFIDAASDKKTLLSEDEDSIKNSTFTSNILEETGSQCQLPKEQEKVITPSPSSFLTLDGTKQVAPNDVGIVSNGNVINDYTKKSLLEDHWQPSSNCQLPYSEHKIACKDGSVKIERYLSKKSHEWISLASVFPIQNWIILQILCHFCSKANSWTYQRYGTRKTGRRAITKL